MKLVINEKTSLGTALAKVEKFSNKLSFDYNESDVAKKTVINFHDQLTTPGSKNMNSEFSKIISSQNGKNLKIIGVSSSQQGLLSRLRTI